jgi:quercetin dioxygenase-like cupin family protein
VTELGFGDIWYFPKGQAHTVQGIDDENEYLLAFDDADFDRAGYVTNNTSLAPGLSVNTSALIVQHST